MESEADLNDCLNWFLVIGTAEEDILQALLESDFLATLVGLLAHPNSDIGNAVIAVLHELLHDEEGFEDVELMADIAIKAVECDLLTSLNLHAKRLKPADIDDNQALFQGLQLVEDIFDLIHVERNPKHLKSFYESLSSSMLLSLLAEMFSQDPKAVKTEAFTAKLTPGDATNRLYAAELTATIFQLSAADLMHAEEAISSAINKLWTEAVEGICIVETLLVAISAYRSRDPIDSDEQEYMFNLFDILGALLLNSRSARVFFASDRCEGFELIKLFLKEINMARIRAIQLLDYTLAANDSQDLCVQFLNSGGLKVISPIFMGKGVDALSKKYPKLLASADLDEAHICTIMSSLFRNTPMASSAYFRLLAKFVEAGGEKFSRLLELHAKYQLRVDQFDVRHGVSEDSDEWLLDRINAGLFELQQIDVIILILINSSKVLEMIRSETGNEIELELFEAVQKESKQVLQVSPEVVHQVKQVVFGWLKELQDLQSIPIALTLKRFYEQE